MPEEPAKPPAPRPVIPIEPPAEADPDATSVMPIAEPGVMTPAPFAQVYAPPPPLPQAYYPPAYPPAPYPPPAPAWPDPVAYRASGAAGYSRPGIVTALGVTAIIVASLSFITSLFSGCTAMVVTANARRSASVAKMTINATTAAPATAAPAVESSNVNGLPPNERATVVRGLRDRMHRILSTERERQLDGFLAQHGKLIFDVEAQPLTRERVKNLVTQAGQEFATAGKAAPDFFIFKGNKLPGRLLLKDDAAIYKPDDYSPTLTSHAKPPADDVEPPAPAPAFVSGGLDDDQAQAVLGRVRELSNGKVTETQLLTLNTLMQSPTGANWITGSSTIPGITAQVKSAAVQADGTVTITFTMGKLTLDPQGSVVGAIPAAPVQSPTTSPSASGPFWMGAIGVDKGSCALAIAEAAVSGLLAIYLLVIAILTLRQSGTSRKLFIIYGVLKVLCGIAGIVAFAWMMSSLTAAADPTGFAQSMVAGFKATSSAALTLTAIGLAYPIAVLIILMLSKSAREYYSSGG